MHQISTFFLSQLDYIFFIYGLSFIILFLISRSLAKAGNHYAHFLWVGYFGLLHGTNEWCDLISITLGSTEYFNYFRFFLMTISFLTLLEFGRNVWNIFWHIKLKWWFHLFPLLFFSLLLSLYSHYEIFSMTLLSNCSRYAFCLPAGILIFIASRKNKRYLPIGISILIYSFFAGAIVLQDKCFPMNSLNTNLYLELTGTPIQLIRALLAILIASIIWNIYIHIQKDQHLLTHDSEHNHQDGDDNANHHVKEQLRRQLYPLYALLLLVIVGWLLVIEVGTVGLHRDLKEQKYKVNLVNNKLDGRIEIVKSLVETIPNSPSLDSLKQGTGNSHQSELDFLVDHYQRVVNGSIVYILNTSGTTIASSNRHTETSFVGKNYSVRPYFKQAMLGNRGDYFAIGLTSKIAGYYASYPIYDSSHQSVIAIVAIKITFNSFPLKVSGDPLDLLMLVHKSGLIIMSSSPDLYLKNLWPLDLSSLQEIKESEQFPLSKDHEDQTKAILQEKPVPNTNIKFQENYFFYSNTPISFSQMDLIILSEDKWMVYYRLLGIALMLFFSFIIIIFFVIHQSINERTFLIADSEKRYRFLFENKGIASFLLNEMGKIILVNERFLQLVGARNNYDVINQNFYHQFLPRMLDSDTQHIENREVALTTLLKNELTVLLNTEKMIDRLTIGSIIDISDRKRAEREKEEMQDQLLHASKLASIGTLAAGVAHEINNPLTIMRCLMDVQQESISAMQQMTPELEDSFKRQEVAINRIIKIVNGLKTYARTDNNEEVPLNFHNVIDNTLDLISGIITKTGLSLITDMKAEKSMVMGHPGKFEQVLVNLINNASYAVKGINDGFIKIETHSDMNELHIAISDNGHGIEKNMFKNLFNPFFTTKPPGEGTGLGLSVAQSIIRSFGGRIKAESEVGVGTTFTLSLPLLKKK